MHGTTTSTPRRPVNQLRALVVDDDPFQLELLVDSLSEMGLDDVKKADSGDAAMRMIVEARTVPFDLLISDLHMPGMDGFEFMAEVAQRGFKGALIIVSGQTSDVLYSASLVARLRRFNLLGMLAKPVDKSALAALVHQLS
jgi:CheY-like chemotaxis protein